MNNRDELEGLMMLFRAMSGETNVIEHMEAEGQQEVVINKRMAREMSPSREEWEKLGFEFTEIPGDCVLCNAKLPEGWSIKSTDHSMWNDIIDANGMKRGSMFYKAAFYDRSAHMGLNRRYDVCSDYIEGDNLTIEVYFGNNKEKLFVAGQVCIPNGATREERLSKYAEQKKLYAIAKQYGDQFFPGWEDIHAYWENEKDNSFVKAKK